MMVAVDIGGSKTLIASVDDNYKIVKKEKFPTPKDYQDFAEQLIQNIRRITSDGYISTISIGSAGIIDRVNGVIKQLTSLGWLNKPIASDLSNAFRDVKVILENDANLAGLAEANSLEDINQKVLYVTFSTGIGTGFVENGILVPELLDSEGGHMVFEHNGQFLDWESLASGRAIVEKYGKKAAELDDPAAWAEIAKNMALGIVNNCTVFPVSTVIIGGGVGTYFAKYADQLNQAVVELARESKIVRPPKIVGAKNAEEAVMLGCIILAKQYEQC